MKLVFKQAIAGFAAVCIVGCASIMHGTTQSVGISSTPTGAMVTVDNKPLGNTPVFADLKRKQEHVVTIEMPGYEKAELTLTRNVSGWVWGNIVIGGLIGLGIDAISGGLYKLSPDQLNAELRAQETTVAGSADGIYIVAALVPDPTWQKIGNLAPDPVN